MRRTDARILARDLVTLIETMLESREVARAGLSPLKTNREFEDMAADILESLKKDQP